VQFDSVQKTESYTVYIRYKSYQFKSIRMVYIFVDISKHCTQDVIIYLHSIPYPPFFSHYFCLSNIFMYTFIILCKLPELFKVMSWIKGHFYNWYDWNRVSRIRHGYLFERLRSQTWLNIFGGLKIILTIIPDFVL
jgi:hypothetical protein